MTATVAKIRRVPVAKLVKTFGSRCEGFEILDEFRYEDLNGVSTTGDLQTS